MSTTTIGWTSTSCRPARWPRAPDRLRSTVLYRNLGDGTFEDITEISDTGDAGYGSGVAAADYDRDGDVDIYVTNLGRNVLLRNHGDGTFDDVARSAGVDDDGYGTSAAFADLDGDGYLDLYVVNYIAWSLAIERQCRGLSGLVGYCAPDVYDRPQADRLFLGSGESFRDVSRTSGISDVEAAGLGLVISDFDGDGDDDVYVANDGMANNLWLNQGDATFVDEALLRGSALNRNGIAEAGMGVAIGDLDDDGDEDLFVTHLSQETNTLYRKDDTYFADVTDVLGLGAVSQPYTGFGTGFLDFDNDGLLDLFIANGKVRLGDSLDEEYGEPNQLLRRQADGTFVDASSDAGAALTLPLISRAAAFGDYDNDGDLDIAVVNNGGQAQLLRNDTPRRANWLTVALRGSPGKTDRDALGARVSVEVQGRVRWGRARAAYGYCASHDPRVHFGLGVNEVVDRLVVEWPDGTSTELEDVAANQIFVVREGGDARLP